MLPFREYSRFFSIRDPCIAQQLLQTLKSGLPDCFPSSPSYNQTQPRAWSNGNLFTVWASALTGCCMDHLGVQSPHKGKPAKGSETPWKAERPTVISLKGGTWDLSHSSNTEQWVEISRLCTNSCFLLSLGWGGKKYFPRRICQYSQYRLYFKEILLGVNKCINKTKFKAKWQPQIHR